MDTICIDKTGTLTAPALRVVEVVAADGVQPEELEESVGLFAAAAPARNATLAAIAAAFPRAAQPPEELVPFASRRRWSGERLGGVRYVLGAPELFPLGPLAAAADARRDEGRRVVAFGTTDVALVESDRPPPLSRSASSCSVRSSGATRARPSRSWATRTSSSSFSPATPRPPSARSPRTPGFASTPPLDGGELPDGDVELDALATSLSVVGRISPDGKRRVVESLHRNGRYVAMIGDGSTTFPP